MFQITIHSCAQHDVKLVQYDLVKVSAHVNESMTIVFFQFRTKVWDSALKLWLPMTVRTRILITFTILCIYIFLAVFLVPYVGKSLAFSIYYTSSRSADVVKNLAENAIRVNKAKQILKEFHSKYSGYQFPTRAVMQPEFCFVIISVSRPANTQYLTQVVASLVPQIVDTNYVFTVYNAEGPTHLEAVNLSRIVPVETHTTHSATKSKFVKEKEDYTSVLEWCLGKGAKFAVILQDDALPPRYFIDRMKFILQHRVSADTRKWAFLKLYYPEKWEGWAKEWRIILELILSSILVGAILTAVTFIIQFMIVKISLTALDSCVRLLFSFLLVLYVLLALGRPHWLALRNVSPHFSSVVPSPGCCIPAVIYPQAHLSSLVSYLKDTKASRAFPLDLALDKFAEEKSLDGLLVVPNLVKHIGFVSSLGKGWKAPKEFRI